MSQLFFRVKIAFYIIRFCLLQGKRNLRAVFIAPRDKYDLCLRVFLADQIADKHARGTQTENAYSLESLFSRDLPRFGFRAFILSHLYPEIMSLAEIFHPLPLKDHTCVRIAEHQLFCQ